MIFSVTAVLLLGAPLVGQQTEKTPREQVGEVLGKPVYRDEIIADKGDQLSDELHRLFISPVMKQYRQLHKNEIVPTEDEINTVTNYFNKQHQEKMKEEEPQIHAQLQAIKKKMARNNLTEQQREDLKIEEMSLQAQQKPPGRFFSVFMLRNWKFQRHLYIRYGGGRLLWQQAGVEAFDATRQWLETHEKNGQFKITDPKLRSVFYEYWTTQDHHVFLTDDKERIQNELLEPEWAPKISVKNKPQAPSVKR